MFIVKVAEHRPAMKGREIHEWFYCGRRGGTVVSSKDVECAKQFPTMRGARRACHNLWKKFDIRASMITQAEDYIDYNLMRWSTAEERWVIW